MASGLQIVVMEFTQFSSECIVVRVEDQGSLGLFLTIGRDGARQGNDIQQAAAGKEYEPERPTDKHIRDNGRRTLSGSSWVGVGVEISGKQERRRKDYHKVTFDLIHLHLPALFYYKMPQKSI